MQGDGECGSVNVGGIVVVLITTAFPFFFCPNPGVFWLGPFFRKAVADSNAPVQEKALDALIAFLKAADADAGR